MPLVVHLITQTAEEMSSKHHSSPRARYHTTSECYRNARRAQWRPQEAVASFPSICIFSPVFTMFLSTVNLYDGYSLSECHPHKDTKPTLFLCLADPYLHLEVRNLTWYYQYSKMAGQSNRGVTSRDTNTSLYFQEIQINWQNQQWVFSPGVCQ